MKSISTTINNQSNRETIFFLILSTIIFSFIIGYISYIRFFVITEKLVSSAISNITRSLHNGDEFSIKSELSFLFENEGFYYIKIQLKR